MSLVKLILTIVLSLSVLAAAQEVEDETEFSYESGSPVGPEHWGEIHPDWAACGTGRMQSPIDVAKKRVQLLPGLEPLRLSLRPAPAVLENRGHDIMVKWEEDDDAGAIWVNGTEYRLQQLHWHSPSEHTINGRRYPLEMHMVHESADQKVAVVGILYTIGRPDTFLAKLETAIKKIANKDGAKEKVGLVDPRQIKRGSRKFYRYMGSLTTPPCTEGVVWTIVKKVRTVSKLQVNLLREAVHGASNARPIQPINGRLIGLYRPQKVHY